MKRSRGIFVKKAVLFGASCVIGFGALEASAECVLKLTGPSTTVMVADGDPDDANAEPGAVTFDGSIDMFSVAVVTCVSKPAVGSANLAMLDVTGVTVTDATPGGGTLLIEASDTNFFPGSSGGDTNLMTDVGGTTNGTSSFQAFLDTLNNLFGTSGAICTTGLQGPFGPGSFDDTKSAACVTTGPISLTYRASVTLGKQQVQSFGSSTEVARPAEKIGCRFTGGGVDTDYNWDHTLESGQMIKNGAGNLPDVIDRYQFGGQAGARTGQQPTPSGEWQHHQQTGPSGAFAFHGGTSSAAPGTWIADIRCSDPGFCFPARPAPAKQLDFDGVGTFSNVGKGKSAPVFAIADPNVIPEPSGKKDAPFTFHWFEVNIDDLGEPGRKNDGAPGSETCPGRGFGEKSAGMFYPDPVGNPGDFVMLDPAPLANCECPDFYRITIFKGVLSNEVSYLPNGKVDPASMNRTDVIYEVYGYIDGGNLQIHPPTGYDTK